MSQIVTVKRKITHEQLRAALDQSEHLSLSDQHDWGFTIKDSSDPKSFTTFANGVLEATSPSDELFNELEKMASLLNAEIVIEDEVQTVQINNKQRNGREINIFWPVLVLLLLSLLVWRW